MKDAHTGLIFEQPSQAGHLPRTASLGIFFLVVLRRPVQPTLGYGAVNRSQALIDCAPRRHPGLELGVFKAVGAVVNAGHQLQFWTCQAPQ